MTDLFQTNETVTIDPNKDYLPDLVGEGKKFKDPSALARGKMESDVMIEALLVEKRELEAELKTRQTAEDILEKIQKARPKDSDNQTTEEAPKGISKEEIDKLIADRLQIDKKQSTQEANAELVQRTLQEKLGNDYSRIAVQKARSIGLTQDDLEAMARERPKALLALLVPETGKQDLFTPKPSVTIGAKSTAGLPQTFAEWQTWKKANKENANRYFDPDLARERFRQKREKGDNW